MYFFYFHEQSFRIKQMLWRNSSGAFMILGVCVFFPAPLSRFLSAPDASPAAEEHHCSAVGHSYDQREVALQANEDRRRKEKGG